MSKIVKIDSKQLSDFKWKKCVLGVIHPEHTSITKIDPNDSFSDLYVSSKPAQLNFKPPYVPPASVVIKQPSGIIRRPKSAKPGTDIVGEALRGIPQARPDRKNFIRTSMIVGKDLKNSISDYKNRINKKKQENNKEKKREYEVETENIEKVLNEKFESTKISEQEYSEIKEEMKNLSYEYEAQIYKEKVIINFLAMKNTELDLQEINRMFDDLQLAKEKELIFVQHFVLKLKDLTITQSRSLMVYVRVDTITKVLNDYPDSKNEEKKVLIDFLEKLKIQLRKDGLDKDVDDAIPFGVFEKTVSSIFMKWEKEKAILEGFLNDITNAFCGEYGLSKEDVLRSKQKNKREMELKVVAEFINMYLERLHQSIESKIRGLQKLKDVIENGKKPEVSWTDVLMKFIKIPEKKTVKKLEFSQKEPAIKKGNPRSKSPKEKHTRKVSPENKPSAKKSNIGRSAKKFTSGLTSIPESKKERKISPVNVSKKNPLDSVTISLDDDIAGVISDLNPTKTRSQPKLEKKEVKQLSSNSRKPEMDSTDGLFNFRPQKVFEPHDVFSSIDKKIEINQNPIPSDSVFKSISDIESVRFPRKYPETRSEFMKSGIKPFHPYMDKDGQVFNPHERFPNVKPDDLDPLDPYFLEEIGNSSPNPAKDWYLRSHHLRSFTNHPLSINDDPNFYKAQVQVGLKESIVSKTDERERAIEHLEKTIEDLKCEINTRKRIAYVNNFSNEDRLTGIMPKAISPAVQGLSTVDKEGLVMHTYESILDELRARERNILNQKRAEAYEMNRPPVAKWYELKSNDFTLEMVRHTNSLKPKEEHQNLLNYLAIPDLY